MLKYVIILFCCAFSSSEEIKVFYKNDYNFIYSEKFKIPLYVKYTINRSDINGTIKRTNNFKSDKKISQNTAGPKNYKKSGYDRGHMKPAAVSKGSIQDMKESFLMHNICPQLPQFNRAGWKKIEAKVRSLMKSQDSLIVYSGPVLIGIDEFIGVDRVGVPKFFYKAILYGDSTKAYGYLCPHEKLAKDITKYIVSIDSIESLIGIDLYKGLNENLEK